jgi:hypothetical protein
MKQEEARLAQFPREETPSNQVIAPARWDGKRQLARPDWPASWQKMPEIPLPELKVPFIFYTLFDLEDSLLGFGARQTTTEEMEPEEETAAAQPDQSNNSGQESVD